MSFTLVNRWVAKVSFVVSVCNKFSSELPFENDYVSLCAQPSKVPTMALVLRCAAVCCNVLRCVAVCCHVLQCVAVCCSVVQCVAVC